MAQGKQRQVKFGIFDHIESTSGSSNLETLYKERIAFVQQAERAGFTGYHVAEHHCTPLSAVPSPSVFLGALATHTSTIRLGTMVYLLPFYNPLRLMLEVAMLDNMSGGRFEMGIGRGVHPYEHAYYNVPTLQSSEIYEEALEVILKGFTSDQLNHKGEHYRFNNVPVHDLKPVQKPYPPLWYGAVKESSIIYAAQRGLNICTNGPVEMNRKAISLYRKTRAEYWKSPTDLQPHIADPLLGLQRFVYVGETEAEALEVAEDRYQTLLTNINKLYSYYGLQDNKVTVPFGPALKAGVMLAGTADQIHDILADQIDRSGANYLMLNFAFGTMSAAETSASLGRFASDVMPRLLNGQPAIETVAA